MTSSARVMHPPSRGIVLFLALVVLLTLSLLGMALASSAILENRMSAGMRNLHLSRMATDSAIAEARERISRAAAVGGAGRVCAQMLCAQRSISTPLDPAAFMRAASTRSALNPFHRDLAALDAIDRSARLQANPVYVVEYLGPSAASGGKSEPKSVHWFRITASAEGGATGYSQVAEHMLAIVQE